MIEWERWIGFHHFACELVGGLVSGCQAGGEIVKLAALNGWAVRPASWMPKRFIRALGCMSTQVK